MNIKLRCSLILFLLSLSVIYADTEKDSTVVSSDTFVNDFLTETYTHFPELQKKFPLKSSVDLVSEPEFNSDLINREFPVSSLVNEARAEAQASFRAIDSTGQWISSFSNENIQVLPVGIKKEVSGVEYQLGFTHARFTKNYTELTVFVKIVLPQSDKEGVPIELFFGANNIKLSHQGGIIGDANLVLLGDMFIPFNSGKWLMILKGGFDYKTGQTANRTYVSITCDGVKEMSIEGEVQFSRSMLKPIGPNGEPQPETRTYEGGLRNPIEIPNRVTGAFKVIASDWNDMIVDISLSPFVLTNQPNKFMFSVNRAVFDFSDLRTENINFPQHYYDKNLLVPSRESWRGVYVQSLEIGLPDEFKTKSSIATKRRVRFQASNLIIDNYGVSGYFSAENVITLDEGRTSASKAWEYAVDKIGLNIASNRLVGADLTGRILLPISTEVKQSGQEDKKKIGLAYSGIISEDEYSLTVSTLDTLSFDVFKAKAQLLPNSGVQLNVVEGNFKPVAFLNGRMAISTSQKESLLNEGEEYASENQYNKEKNTIQFKGIEFQDLILQTESPIIQVGYFGYRDELKIANFPVSIADIAFTANDYQVGLEFDLMINLMNKESKGFAATSRLGIYGKLKEEQFKQRWEYDKTDFSEILIDATIGKVGFSGALMLFERDQEYNDGFMGKLSLDMFDTEGLIEAKGLFGNKEGYRYFYVDFIGILPTTVPILPPIGMSAIGGGLSYNMERADYSFTDTAQENMASEDIGLSLSGIRYVPNNDIGLDLRAMAFLTIQGTQAFRGKIMLSMLFNKHGGLNRIGFDGSGEFMASASLQANVSVSLDLKALKKALGLPEFLNKITPDETEIEIVDFQKEFAKSSIKADLNISFDFRNSTLHGESNIYVSLVDGLVSGIGPEGRAGWAVFHFAPSEWYIHIGTPADRLGLRMGIGPVSLETGAYFMIGDRIPGSPPPPPEVADILGVDLSTLDYMRDENALGVGKGFAFGANFKMDTGDINFLLLYARFRAGVGFDIMVKDYGEARCVNTGDRIGINGWYANGQAYAYLQGELGINIKLFFVRKKIPIIKGGAAILMQAKGPNPFWLKGYAAGYYDLLGGLVKGSFRLKVTLGEECVLDNVSPLGGIKMITDLTPADDSADIDVFAAPQAAFAMPVNKPIVIPEDDGDKTYKVILDTFSILDEAGNEISGDIEWGRMNDRATLISEDILPPNTKLKVLVVLSFQERVNGVYKTVMVDGKKAIEQEERSFTTGTAPDHIPLYNIQYSYPVVEQQHFFRNEYKTGYIQLKRGQDYLFDNSQWKSEVKFIDNGAREQKSRFNYTNADNKVHYSLPDLKKNMEYGIMIVSSSKNSASTSSSQSTTDTKDLDEGNTIEIRKNIAENVLKDGEIDRLSYNFKTSNYNTFKDKINDLKVTDDDWGKLNSTVIYLSSKVNKSEGFDIAELTGNTYTENKPLILIESDLEDRYFEEDINPVIYSKYTANTKYAITRNTEPYGYVPKRALPISSYYLSALENGTHSEWRATRFPFSYNLPYMYFRDFLDVRDRVNNDYAIGMIPSGASELSILSEDYKFMLFGKYRVYIKYILPGNISGTSTIYTYKNPIKIRQ